MGRAGIQDGACPGSQGGPAAGLVRRSRPAAPLKDRGEQAGADLPQLRAAIPWERGFGIARCSPRSRSWGGWERCRWFSQRGNSISGEDEAFPSATPAACSTLPGPAAAGSRHGDPGSPQIFQAGSPPPGAAAPLRDSSSIPRSGRRTISINPRDDN